MADQLADLPPSQSSIDALNNTTPNLADVLADLHPLAIEHRCLEYCYTKLGRSTPLAIKHRCLQYHYTKHARSTGRSTPHQSSIHALNTATPNLTDVLADQPPQSSIDALNTTTPNLADLLADALNTATPNLADVLTNLPPNQA